MEVGEVHGANDIIPQAELAETRFYKEWIEPQGIGDAIAVNLEKGLTRSSFIVIRTDAATGAADESMYGRLAALVPHLQRAVAIGRLLDQSKVAEQRLTETLNRVEAAVFLIGRNGAITFTNDPARALINEGLLLRQQDGALHAIDANADRILGEMILSAEKGDASIGVRGVAVPLMNSAQERWFAHVLPLTSGRRRKDGNAHAAVAALFIRNTPPNAPLPLESLAKRYKLTASEVRVLDAVLKISGVKAIADMLGLSQATVKTHLHNLFRKTGASRQSDLVKLIAGI
jgi:DNA-binding CsgD family transcriptional regulator